jgi:hypothetical protein
MGHEDSAHPTVFDVKSALLECFGVGQGIRGLCELRFKCQGVGNEVVKHVVKLLHSREGSIKLNDLKQVSNASFAAVEGKFNALVKGNEIKGGKQTQAIQVLFYFLWQTGYEHHKGVSANRASQDFNSVHLKGEEGVSSHG